MNSFEVNKVLGAVLGALLFAAGSGFVAELIYHPKPAGKAGYDLPEPEHEAAAAAAPEAKVEPIAVRLASANVEKGEAGTKACHACHNFEKGGPNKVGPDLYGVVERPKGSHPGFEYSAAMKEKGGTWTYADLDEFLTNPKGYVKGTKMAFAGIASPQERANVIAYLRKNADDPKPLPAVEKTEAPPAAAPAAAKPGDKPAAAPADKPTAAQPAASKPSEGKESPAKPADAGTAKPVEEKSPGSPRAPSESSDRNAPTPPAAAHDGDQQGQPSSAIPAEPTAPTAPAAKEPAAQANPEAVDRAKELDVTVPGKDPNAPAPKP
ncbi:MULTISPECIES: c-type cytochrome [unclassified Methylobacterium]|jgi:cytochrome c|uniref:c-type cytochrome n=1 Tax=unclassified Methylobacterium TaxID=2615210 RepID=UPI001353D11D|nr:cytochrome c family protein [Methylobacterium sp. 2A]MWV20936.1 c-type cytochrome [Methylobacterium sp. 2A]